MFEDATFHSRGILPSQTPKWMLLTLALNLTVLAILVVIPLIHPQGLPGQLLPHLLLAPPPPPATLAHSQPRPQSSVQMIRLDPFAAPPVIPIGIANDPAPAPFDPNAVSSPNAVSGSDGPGNIFHPEPPPTVKPAPAQPKSVTLSTGVTEGLLIHKVAPIYPPIAVTARISGTVVLAATISTAGTIKNLRVLSGHPMLQSAALTAVENWRYRPYQLNNQPVEVETTINVVFSLGQH